LGKERLNMKKVLFFFIISLSFITCNESESPTENIIEGENSNNVVIDRNKLADMLGNKDGIPTKDELTKLNNYFNTYNIGWAVGNDFNNYDNSIPGDTIKKYFQLYTPLYKDSTELKKELSTVASFATPFIGVYVFESNKEVILIKLYRVVGNPNNGSWEEIKIL
jgi:hypothetical protein